MKRRIITAFFLLMMLPTFGQINMVDSTAQVISYWDKGEKQTYSVTNEKIKIIDSDTTSREATSYDVDITVLDSTGDSYSIEWVYKNFQNNNQNPMTKKLMGVTNNLKVIFKTTELGEFVEVLNWKEIKEYIKETTEDLKKEFSHVPEMDTIINQVVSLFSTQEAIETAAIKDIQQFHTFHGAKYTLGEVVEATMKMPNILGTEPFDANMAVLLEEINEEEENFVLRVYQEIDEEQLMNATFNYLVKMAKSMKIDPPKLEDLKELKNETLTSSRMHVSGWVIYSIRTTTVVSENVTQIEERIIEIKE